MVKITEEKITFQNNNQNLIGIINWPDKPNPPAIIMVHGFGGMAFKLPFEETAKAFCKEGYKVLRFAFRGYESGGMLKLSSAISDLKSAIDFFGEDVGIFTESLGGSIALLSNDARIQASVLAAPAIHMKKLFSTDFADLVDRLERGESVRFKEGKHVSARTISPDFWNEIKEIDSISEDIVEKIKFPVLLLHSKGDAHVPLKNSEDLFRMLKCEKNIKLLDSEQHVITREPDRDLTIKYSIEWFNRWLK